MLDLSEYNEVNDIMGIPQIISGIPFYPLKVLDVKNVAIMQTFLAKDKMEFIDKTKMPLEGIKCVYKNNYLKSMLYYYSVTMPQGCYLVLNNLKDLLNTVCQMPVEEKEDSSGDGVAIICNTKIVEPLDVFDSPFYFIIRKGSNIIKIDDNDFSVIRECILRQSSISLKSLEGYRPDMEAIKKDRDKSVKEISFSDEIFLFIALSKIDINSDNFRNYTLYQFKRHFNSLQQIADCKILYPLQINGEVKFGSKIKYYSEPINYNKGRYDDILINSDDFSNSALAKSVDGFAIPDVNKKEGGK